MHFKGEYWIIENMCLKIWYMPLKPAIRWFPLGRLLLTLMKGTIYRQKRRQQNIQGNARETKGTWQERRHFLHLPSASWTSVVSERFQSGFRPLWGVWLILMEGTIYRQKRVEHNTQGNAKQHDVSSNSTSSGVILRYLLELAPAAWHTAYARHQ